MKEYRISVIGAGAVGATTAYALLLKNISADILLVDVNESRCAGEVLDLHDILSFSKSSSIKIGTFAQAGQSDIIIICAGARQEPGQSRTELLQANKKIISGIISSMQPINDNAIIIVVTNPLDVLVRHILQQTKLPKSQIIGSGTFLDSQRLRGLIGKRLGISQQSIHAYVLGEHGDSQFVAWSSAVVGGTCIKEIGMSQEELEAIAQQAQQTAYDIIACKGSTYYGIATCVAEICQAIIADQRKIIPVSSYHEQYDVCFSLPSVIGRNGIEQIIDIPLDANEQSELQKSINALKSLNN